MRSFPKSETLEAIDRLFDEGRVAAGGSRYVHMHTDYQPREDCAAWAEAEAQRFGCPAERVIKRSLDHFFADDDASAKAWPFKWWAADPGKYLTLAIRAKAAEERKKLGAEQDRRRRERLERDVEPCPPEFDLPPAFYTTPDDAEAHKIGAAHLLQLVQKIGRTP